MPGRPPGVRSRRPARDLRLRRQPLPPVPQHSGKAERTRKARLVAEFLEDVDHTLQLLCDLLVAPLRDRVGTEVRARTAASAAASASPAARPRSTASDSTESERSSSPDSISARPRDGRRPRRRRSGRGQQSASPFEQIHRRGRVGTSVRLPAGGGEAFGRALSELLLPLARRPKICEAAVRLLEVVADYLVELLTLPSSQPAKRSWRSERSIFGMRS